MSHLMGIRRDQDVVSMTQPPIAIMMDFEINDVHSPTLEPMNPHLTKGLMKLQWNQQL